ncbi:MAG: molybdopterin dinucleotide-binding protein [Candidatus Bathyarchaeota archaeon]|nr:MAG: molybdopterin dinucleotide-binding protein [Candidatus Bathyarchaeota archaeon]
MTKLRVLLQTVRTIDQGTGKEHGKLSEHYRENVAICQMDPKDIRTLRMKGSEKIKVTTNFGSVVLRLVESLAAPHPNIIFIPYGPWASLIVDPETHGTWMPSLKGIPAEVEPAFKEDVLSVPALLEEHYRRN